MTWWQWCLVLLAGAYAAMMVGYVLWMLLACIGIMAHEEGEKPSRVVASLGLGLLLGNVALGLPLALAVGAYLAADRAGWHWAWSWALGLAVAGGLGAVGVRWLDKRSSRRL